MVGAASGGTFNRARARGGPGAESAGRCVELRRVLSWLCIDRGVARDEKAF